MPIENTGLVVIPAAQRIAERQASLDAAIGFPLNYDGTLEDGFTSSTGVYLWEVETGQAVIVDAINPDTAQGANLDRCVAANGLYRRPPTKSRYTFRAVAVAGSITYPAGYFVTGGGADGNARWAVVADTAVTTSPTLVIFEAVDAGAVSVDGITTFRMTTPVAGLVSVTYDPGDADPVLLGRLRESDSELRVRNRRLRGALAGPTAPGLRLALLGLSFVTAVSLARSGAASIAITVVPSPVGSDQELLLAETIRDTIGYPVDTTGSESKTVVMPGGGTEVIRWNEGTEQPVSIVLTVALDGVTIDEVSGALLAAIEGVFADLDVGSTLRILNLQVAIGQVSGVVGITLLTLDGGTSDIVPVSTELITIDGTPVIS